MAGPAPSPKPKNYDERIYRKGNPPHRIRNGLILIALAVIGTYLAWTKSIPFQSHYTLHAVFQNAANIRADSPVRIAGVNVGKVEDIKSVCANGGTANCASNYAEVTFTLTGHAILANDWDMPVNRVLEGFADGERDFGTRCRLVLDCVHGFPLELAQSTLASALRHRNDGVVALGLGGDENQPVDQLGPVFAKARDEGLHSVPHAGETAGAGNIRRALDLLGAERIGHGIRALEDGDLVAELRERQIPLEVCPTSNVATGVVRTLDEHPFPGLRDAGLTVTLNSDDPGMFASPLAGEYEVARTVFGLDDAALADLAKAGIAAAFLDDGTKAELTGAVDAWLENAPQ